MHQVFLFVILLFMIIHFMGACLCVISPPPLRKSFHGREDSDYNFLQKLVLKKENKINHKNRTSPGNKTGLTFFQTINAANSLITDITQ